MSVSEESSGMIVSIGSNKGNSGLISPIRRERRMKSRSSRMLLISKIMVSIRHLMAICENVNDGMLMTTKDFG